MEAFSMGDKMIDKHARMFVKYHHKVNTIGYCVKKNIIITKERKKGVIVFFLFE